MKLDCLKKNESETILGHFTEICYLPNCNIGSAQFDYFLDVGVANQGNKYKHVIVHMYVHITSTRGNSIIHKYICRYVVQ